MTRTGTAVVWTVVALLVGILLGYMVWGISNGLPEIPNTGTSSAVAVQRQASLYDSMRTLWSDHVWWTREYIESVAAGNTGQAEAAGSALIQNQVDIGNAIAPYYGTSAGQQLTDLLKDHITIAVEVLAAAKAGDTTKFNEANARWQQNADDIASFLSQANPNWTPETLKDMMQTHLTTTLDEASAALKKDYAGSAAAFYKVSDHMMTFSDMLSTGIIIQFPEKFL